MVGLSWSKADKLYLSINTDFPSRIEDALARYQYQRRIEPERRNIFHKFLQYGGINAGQNFGQGVNDKDLQNMTSDQAMQARSQTSIQQERDKLEINFNKVVQGFLYVPLQNS